MKTIVHLISDEKFIDSMIANFESYSECNNVYIQINNIRQPFETIKSPLATTMPMKEFEREYLDKKGNCDMIILHNLHTYPITKIWKIPRRIKILWLPWGFDLYQTPFQPLIKIRNLYGHLTSDLVKELKPKSDKSFYHSIYDWIISFRWYIYCKLATMRIDYFAGVSEYEHDLMNCSPFFRAKKMIFNYNIDFEKLIGDVENSIDLQSSGWVWLGNSATATNNHLEIMNFIKINKLNVEHLFTPLSYGDDFYAKIISKAGSEMFGNNIFVPLFCFMPQQEYIKQMQKCSIAIFGTMRQQSMGNISIALYLGLKVFFFKNSLLYTHFKKSGFAVFSIEEDLCREIGSGAMPSEVIRKNRELMAAWHSPQTMEKRIKNLVNSL